MAMAMPLGMVTGMAGMAMATLSTITSNVITLDPRLDPKPPQKQKQAKEKEKLSKT